MLILTVWLVIMGAGALCFPRRPRTAGVLFLLAGGFLFGTWTAGGIGKALPINAPLSATLGLSKLWAFRDPAVRAAHVAGWTGKGSSVA